MSDSRTSSTPIASSGRPLSHEAPAGASRVDGDRIPALSALFGEEPLHIVRTLQAHGFDAVIVGGPVRDLLAGTPPKDVDLATSATPDTVRRLFPRTFVQGDGERHGTIGVISRDGASKFEVTTYRLDVETDGRHANVAFTTDLREDLERRDFTINAMAIRPIPGDDAGILVDPFHGAQDLARRELRAVGDASARFTEDRLRVVRGYRFAARYEMDIAPATHEAMRAAVPALASLSRERIRDELLKLMEQVSAPGALARILRLMAADKVFDVILPEVAACAGVTQGAARHAFDVQRHLFEAADAMGPEHPLRRFAMLLHDIGKPATRTVEADGRIRFFEHQYVGAAMADHICDRLAMSKADRKWIVEAVRQHMRLIAVNSGLTERAIRTLLRDLAESQSELTVADLLAIRKADKLGSGVEDTHIDPDAESKLLAQVEAVVAKGQATTARQMDITGEDLMRELQIPQGKLVGDLLESLLVMVIDTPSLNIKSALLARARDLAPRLAANPLPTRRRPTVTRA